MPDPRIPSANPDRRAGPYALVEPIGSGGVGEVWRAWDPRLQRWVAVKRLREKMGAQTIQRFQREARIAAALRHPNVVTVYEFGEQDGRPYLAMELLEGGPLDLKRPLKETVQRLSKVARALHQAHLQGAVHRDLKPGNIVVDARGEPRIVDFGLAHLDEGGDRRLTRSGAMLGTPLYMAPEQVEGRVKDIGPRADVYGLGAILYEAMARRPIFQGANLAALYDRILRKEPATPPGPRDLAHVCLKAVSKRPVDRYDSAEAMADDLDHWLAGEPVTASHPGLRRWVRAKRRWIGTAAAVAVAILGTMLAARGLARADDERARLEREKEALQRVRALDDLVRPVELLMNETRLLWYVPGRDIFPRLERVREEVERLEREALRPGGEGHAKLWTSIASGRHLLGEAKDAMTAVGRALKADPGDARALALKGRLHLEEGFLAAYQVDSKKEAARAACEEALQCFQRSGSSWEGAKEIDRHLGSIYIAYARGDLEEVRRLCAEGLARFGETAGSEEYHVLLAVMEPPAQAAETLTAALTRRPHHPLAYFMRGYYRERAGRTADAVSDYGTALSYWPRMIEVRYRRSHLLQYRDPAGALEDYNAMLGIDGTLRYAREGRARAFLTLGRLEEAQREIESALQEDPSWSEMLGARGWLLAERGDSSGAMRAFEAAISADPENLHARGRKAQLLQDGGRHAEAVEQADRALASAPRRPDLLAVRARSYVGLGRFEEAERDLAQAVALAPGEAGLHHNRGLVLKQLKRWVEAEASFTAALSLDPDLPQPRLERGIARTELRRYAEAVEDLEILRRRFPNVADYHLNVGVLLKELGRNADAAVAIERSLEVGAATWSQRSRAEQLLRELRDSR